MVKLISDNDSPSMSKEFLLAQFAEAIESRSQWASMRDREIQYFLGLIGALSVASGIILQSNMSAAAIIIALHAFVMIITLASYRLFRQIVVLSVNFVRSEVQAALIRRYFVNLDKILENYIMFPISSISGPSHPYYLMSRQVSLRILSYLNSLLLAVCIMFFPVENLLIFFSGQNSELMAINFLIFGVISVMVVIVWFRHHKRWIVRYGDQALEHMDEWVHQHMKIVDEPDMKTEKT